MTTWRKLDAGIYDHLVGSVLYVAEKSGLVWMLYRDGEVENVFASLTECKRYVDSREAA